MNKRGQKAATLGFALILLLLVFYIGTVATIEPLKETLNTVRTSLNCPDAPGFDQTDYDNDTKLEKLTRRPTCFATGLTMIYFVGTVLLATMVWLVSNWRKL